MEVEVDYDLELDYEAEFVDGLVDCVIIGVDGIKLEVGEGDGEGVVGLPPWTRPCGGWGLVIVMVLDGCGEVNEVERDRFGV
ncbi:hypothetical protein Tco_0257143 [Tanacetum coccineum]